MSTASPTARIDWIVSRFQPTQPEARLRDLAPGSAQAMAHLRNDIVILGGETLWTYALAHALRRRFGDIPVILEDKEPMQVFLRRRDQSPPAPMPVLREGVQGRGAVRYTVTEARGQRSEVREPPAGPAFRRLTSGLWPLASGL